MHPFLTLSIFMGEFSLLHLDCPALAFFLLYPESSVQSYLFFCLAVVFTLYDNVTDDASF